MNRYSHDSRGGGGPFLMASHELRGNLQLLAACKMKLHQLLELVQLDHVGKDEIVPSLINSARLLEKVFVDRSRGRNSGEMDEDLFSQASVSGAVVKANGVDLANHADGGPGTEVEVTSSEVPDDRVQEWLTNTFTRRGSVVATAGRRRRLRSLAAVVRTSIYFERMFRGRAAGTAAAGPQPPPVPIAAPALAYLEAGAHLWDFDPFGLAELTGDRPVRNMGLYLFHKFDLIDKFSIQMETLDAFLDLVEAGYKRHGNPYHNCTHSADVAQSCCFIVAQHSLGDWLSDVELLALLFAALVHDFEHTGTTNNYHVQTRSHLALVYNDRSVLESHHVSAVFRRMHETGAASSNLLKGLSQPEYRQFRSMVIDMVLATDMSTHFAQVSAMKDAIPCPENLPRVDILAYILHVADISHPAKNWPLHERWTNRLNEDFFAQGDREKELGLACSPLCDREKTVVASSQVGFIEYIVEPSFNTLIQLLKGVKNLLLAPLPLDSGSAPEAPESEDWVAMATLRRNREHWHELAEAEKKRSSMNAIQEEDLAAEVDGD